MQDTRLGRFFAVDPLSGQYPHNSPYAFSENRVIDAVELEGLEKYLVTGRSFAPTGTFQGDFKDDGRNGWSAQPYSAIGGVSARIHASFLIDIDAKTIESQARSQATEVLWTPLKGVWPIKNPTVNAENTNDGFTNTYKASYSAKNGTGLGPAIDIYYDEIRLLRNSDNLLTIAVNVSGNIFPAQESLITDENGTSLFLGLSQAVGSPLTDVWGDGEGLFETHIGVATDQDGNFMGVLDYDENGNEITLSPDAWNQKVATEAGNPRPAKKVDD